jgi:hypothetical protein
MNEFWLLDILSSTWCCQCFWFLGVLIDMQILFFRCVHFCDCRKGLVSFCVLIFHLFILFDEVSIQIFAHFQIGLFILLFNFKSSLYFYKICALQRFLYQSGLSFCPFFTHPRLFFFLVAVLGFEFRALMCEARALTLETHSQSLLLFTGYFLNRVSHFCSGWSEWRFYLFIIPT